MKKLTISALMAAACIAFSACDEYTLPNPPAQTNPDGDQPAFAYSDLKVTTAVAGDAINLETLRTEGKAAELATYTVANMPAGYSLATVLEISGTEDFEKLAEAPCEVSDTKIAVTNEAFENAILKVFGKDPAPKTVYARMLAYATQGKQFVRLGGPDEYCLEGTWTVTPYAFPVVIEPAYYLVGSFCDWDITKAVKFNQTNPGNQYDNPDFTCAISIDAATAAAGGVEWKIVPESGYSADSWIGAFGVADLSEDGKAGTLVEAPEAKTEAGKITEEGDYLVKIDMATRKFEVSYAFKQLYILGQGQTVFKLGQVLTTTDFVNYSGAVTIMNNWYLSTKTDDTGILWGNDKDVEVSNKDGVYSGMMSVQKKMESKMNFKFGMYFVRANIANLKYSGTSIPGIYLVGGATPAEWNLDKSLPLTHDQSYGKWTIENVALKAGEFKFCTNQKDWDPINFGAGSEPGTIAEHGGNLNIAADEAGNYDIVLDFTVTPNTITLTKK